MDHIATPPHPPGSSVQRILQARILKWVAIPFSRASSWPRDWSQVSCIAGRFFTLWATREAPLMYDWLDVLMLKMREKKVGVGDYSEVLEGRKRKLAVIFNGNIRSFFFIFWWEASHVKNLRCFRKYCLKVLNWQLDINIWNSGEWFKVETSKWWWLLCVSKMRWRCGSHLRGGYGGNAISRPGKGRWCPRTGSLVWVPG